MYSIQFPKKSKVVRVPENSSYEGNNIKYHSIYRLENQTVYVKRTYEENHTQALCGNNENEQEKAVQKVMQRDLRSQIFYD